MTLRPVESKLIELRGENMPPRKRSTPAKSAEVVPTLSKKERVLMMSRYLGTYFAYKAYAVVRECTLPTVRVQKNGKVSIARYEKVRADLIAINHRHQTVIVETKSCPADFRSDTKWESYLPLCNKFYFAADPKTAEYIREAIVERKMKGVGVIAVETVDRVRLHQNVRFIRPARSHDCLLEPAEILWHMALRGSGFVFPGRLQCGNSFMPPKEFWPDSVLP